MKEFLEIMQTWSGIIILLVLAVIGIILSLAGSSSGEERRLNGKDDDHYVLRLPIGRVVFPLILLAVGFALQFAAGFLQERYFADQEWIALAIKIAAAVIFGLLFWTQLAKVLRKRVFVNGDKIIVTPAIGASIETNYKQIRTVANKHAGKDRGVIGKKIRTKEGNRFEVINTMSGYDRFCEQLSEKVELPNLTKKLFKKRDKKPAALPEHEEYAAQDAYAQAVPAAEMSGSYGPESSDPEPVIEESFPEPSVSSRPAESFPVPAPEDSLTESAAETIEEEAAEEEVIAEPAAEEETGGVIPETDTAADESAAEEEKAETEE